MLIIDAEMTSDEANAFIAMVNRMGYSDIKAQAKSPEEALTMRKALHDLKHAVEESFAAELVAA